MICPHCGVESEPHLRYHERGDCEGALKAEVQRLRLQLADAEKRAKAGQRYEALHILRRGLHLRPAQCSICGNPNCDNPGGKH